MRLKALLQWHSLKTRVTLLSLGVFLIGIWSLSLYSIRLLRADLQTVLGDQQFATVSSLAAEINQTLTDHLKALETVAMTIGPADLENPDGVQTRLESLPVLLSQFSGGVVAHRIDGTAIADVPLEVGRTGTNYLDIDNVAAALKNGRSAVGRPVMDKHLQAPVFGMTVPIRDGQGHVVGALSGITDLSKSSFLDQSTKTHFGNTGGYIVLVARQHRLVIASTDKNLVMTTLPAGRAPLIDRFIDGHDGSGVTINQLGVEVLASVKGIAAVPWCVVVARPTGDIFAPIDAMQQRMLLAALLLSLLVGGLTWWMLKRQLAPLLDTVTALTAFKDTNWFPQLLPIPRQDEIGELLATFNHLLTTLAQREATLHESEERYRSFFQESPDGVFVHRNNIIVFANDAMARLLQYDSAATLIGRDWHELVMPEGWPATEVRVASLMSGEASKMPPVEQRYLKHDGQAVIAESAGARVIFAGQPAVLSVIRDITVRKQTEEQRLTDARQQRDTLVREVHHRIKNNLQSVAGLLHRELGRFVELNPRLATAISQIHAIAVVHGLQSDDPGEAIRLCESIRSICKTISDLSQRPLLFHIEHEHDGFRPVRIESNEAVPVALMLNELILNAVKHSPEGGATPTVSLDADGRSARIVVRNALTGKPAFDLGTDEGLGTGLRLVRSLLPAQGAQLTYEIDNGGFMSTHLTLTAPVVEAPSREDAS